MKIAIIGASKKRSKFGNKAVRAYKKQHHVVFPVNPTEKKIEGLRCYPSVRQIPLELDAASLYVPPVIGLKIAPGLIRKGVKKVYLNPGTESEELIKVLREAGIEVIMACSIKAIQVDPKEL